MQLANEERNRQRGLGLGLFFLFDKLFDVILPTGVLSFVLGGR